MKAAFDGKTTAVSDVKLENGREYGASALFFGLAKKIGLDKMIYSRNEDWVKSALSMIIGRIIYQGSKLACQECPKSVAYGKFAGWSIRVRLKLMRTDIVTMSWMLYWIGKNLYRKI